MDQILGQKMPTELIMNVLKFSRHPVAELLQPLIRDHQFHRDSFNLYCKERGRQYNDQTFNFLMVFFLVRRIELGKKRGKCIRDSVRENTYLLNKFAERG